jgi:hypothetical protein
MTPQSDIVETSLARLSDHDWHILSNTWSRGVDWYVQKVGRKWAPIEIFGAFPLFKTKREAAAAATTLLLRESSNRSVARLKQEEALTG